MSPPTSAAPLRHRSSAAGISNCGALDSEKGTREREAVEEVFHARTNGVMFEMLSPEKIGNVLNRAFNVAACWQ